MSKLDKLVQEIRSQVGEDFISTDIIDAEGLSIAGDSVIQGFSTEPEKTVKEPSKLPPAPPLVWRGTDFSIKPDMEVKKVKITEIEEIHHVFDSSDGSARFAAVMKLAAHVSSKLLIGKVDDNLITTDKVYILSRFLGEGDFLWVLAVKRNATLGSVRMMMNEYAVKIMDAIPH